VRRSLKKLERMRQKAKTRRKLSLWFPSGDRLEQLDDNWRWSICGGLEVRQGGNRFCVKQLYPGGPLPLWNWFSPEEGRVS
jgi:hypothetical protein